MEILVADIAEVLRVRSETMAHLGSVEQIYGGVAIPTGWRDSGHSLDATRDAIKAVVVHHWHGHHRRRDVVSHIAHNGHGYDFKSLTDADALSLPVNRICLSTSAKYPGKPPMQPLYFSSACPPRKWVHTLTLPSRPPPNNRYNKVE